jgi:acyl carrier protein
MAAAGMLSENGVCAAFDRNANGMVPGEAAVVLVLRRLADAERDGDRVYASILGSGVNYDGRTNGITAPNGAAQVRLLQDVYKRAAISPESVGYVVAHGTGTRIGDPIEVNALVEAFGSASEQRGFCALTSTKPNIGHTQAASGLVSVISLALSMWHELIPPSINCDDLSDYVRWDESPFFVNRELRAWPAKSGSPRRGGVSSFGFSGTNAHVVLQEYGTADGERAALAEPAGLPAYLLLVSGKSADALSRALTRLAGHLDTESDVDGYVASVSYTLMAGRHHHGHRCALVVHSQTDAVRLLREAAAGNTPKKVRRGAPVREFNPNPHMQNLITDLTDQARGSHHDAANYQHLLAALGDLYCQGYEPAFEALFPATPAITTLPAYPFEKRHFWVDGSRARTMREPELTTVEQAGPVRLRPVTELAAAMGFVKSSTKEPETNGRPVEPVQEPVVVRVPVVAAATPPESLEPLGLVESLRESLARALFLEIDEVDVDAGFTELGLDSVVGVEWIQAVNREFGCSVGTTKIYQYPTVRQFADFLAAENGVVADAPVVAPAEVAPVVVPQGLVESLRESLARALFLEVDEVDVDQGFTELGLDSVVGVEWIQAVNRDFGCSVGTTKIYQYPTVRQFADFIAGETPTEDELDRALAQVYDGEIDVQEAHARLSALATEA